MSNVKKWGGPRNGSGRKPSQVKKVSLFIYPLASEIEALGGKEAAKVFAEQAIARKAKKCG